MSKISTVCEESTGVFVFDSVVAVVVFIFQTEITVAHTYVTFLFAYKNSYVWLIM